MSEEPYETITLEGTDYRLQVELRLPVLRELYRQNPDRVTNVLEAHIHKSLGDILAPESLDEAIHDIRIDAQTAVIELLREARREGSKSQQVH